MTDQMLQAVITDSREDKWLQKLNFGGIPVSVAPMDTGDFWLACNDGSMIIVERKTPNDFLNTLKEDRLFPQMSRMVEKRNQGYWPYLLITGEFRISANGKVYTDRETGWDWKTVQGALLSIQEMGIFVTYCAGDTDVEAALIRLANRNRSPEMLIRPAREAKFMGLGAAFLCGFPDIGPERVGPILDKAGSVAWALVALTDRDSVLPGVGEGIKNNVRHVLGLGREQQLGIVVEHGKEVLTVLPLGEQ